MLTVALPHICQTNGTPVPGNTGATLDDGNRETLDDGNMATLDDGNRTTLDNGNGRATLDDGNNKSTLDDGNNKSTHVGYTPTTPVPFDYVQKYRHVAGDADTARKRLNALNTGHVIHSDTGLNNTDGLNITGVLKKTAPPENHTETETSGNFTSEEDDESSIPKDCIDYQYMHNDYYYYSSGVVGRHGVY